MGVGVDDVASLRTLLRGADLQSRRSAMERLDSWGALRLDQRTASAVLRAATASYPWLGSDRSDPADRLARLLWNQPRQVSVGEVEAAYLVAGDAVRRSLLHLLALRRDLDGLRAVAFLIGPDGPADLLPVPTTSLLEPLLDMAEVVEMAPLLGRVAARRGWVWHACDLLSSLARDGRLLPSVAVDVVDAIAPLVMDLVDTCDRVVRVPGEHNDPTRPDRQRIGALVGLLRALPGEKSDILLLRVLSAADPRVAASAVAALADHGAGLAPERLEIISRDPEARSLLRERLEEVGRPDLMPPAFRRGPERAEADLVRWLACETELGTGPDEVEWIGTVPVEHGAANADSPHSEMGAAGDAHLFRFRVRSPHWSCARGWMVGAAGPYLPDGSPGTTMDAFAFSLYDIEDELTPEDHFRAILLTVEARPESGDAA